MSDNNHFKDERYFGHTRSFEDAQGVRHVVETQSDLMQRTKGANAEAVPELRKTYDHLKEMRRILNEPTDVRSKAQEFVKQAETQGVGFDVKLMIGDELEGVIPWGDEFYVNGFQGDMAFDAAMEKLKPDSNTSAGERQRFMTRLRRGIKHT